MAHQIETHNDKAAFVTANVPAWHQLGTNECLASSGVGRYEEDE